MSTKMKRKAALAYSYDKIMKYDYEAYGVADYLSDFYHAGFDVEGKQIFEFAKLLRREGFYD